LAPPQQQSFGVFTEIFLSRIDAEFYQFAFGVAAKPLACFYNQNPSGLIIS
jgi:hypothetical protein